MADWPKTVRVGAVSIEVQSWEDLDEVVERYGGGMDRSDTGSNANKASETNKHRTNLSQTDQALLEQFVDAADRGVLVTVIASALGKRGKGTGPALEAWSRKVGLVTEENASAFERHKRFDGRAYRMTGHYLRTAALILGKK